MSTSRAPVRRVLICDDSITYAAALSRLLRCDPAIEVVGVCPSAETAIARLSELEPTPDLVTMDLELPGMSGGQAIEHIMSVLPMPILALSGAAPGSGEARAALAAGALDAVPKDGLDLLDLDGPGSRAFRRRVKILAGVPVIRHPRAGLGLGHRTPDTPVAGERSAAIIGIAASAGGPQALAAVLAEIPAGFPIPILVVQHMVAGFDEGFARWLDGKVPLDVRLARGGGEPEPGVGVAPEGAHLTVDGSGRLMLDRHRVAGLHRPSADVLLQSLAARAGGDAVAVVLSGMGRDGAEGLDAVRQAGGLTIAQDQASSGVYGMPMAAAECGAQLILGPPEIGRRLSALRPVARAS